MRQKCAQNILRTEKINTLQVKKGEQVNSWSETRNCYLKNWKNRVGLSWDIYRRRTARDCQKIFVFVQVPQRVLKKRCEKCMGWSRNGVHNLYPLKKPFSGGIKEECQALMV